MQVWAITYDPDEFTDQLYEKGVLLVDPESQARIKRFYHRQDACRCLIGRLLPRVLLKQRGIAKSAMSFSSTQAGKPYTASPHTTSGIGPPIAFNVSHDNGLIAMSFAPGDNDPPVFRVGVDVMKVEFSKRETFSEFVKIFSEQVRCYRPVRTGPWIPEINAIHRSYKLTALETRSVLAVPQDEGVQRFFWIWTMKEAYTKALGIGLGFDFSRIEYNVPDDVLKIDGQVPKGWQLIKFEINYKEALYQGVAARYIGEDHTTAILHWSSQSPEWLTQCDAVSFVKKAVDELG